MWQGEEQKRYLQIMEYDASKNHWEMKAEFLTTFLLGQIKLSLVIFTDFDYIAGGRFVERI